MSHPTGQRLRDFELTIIRAPGLGEGERGVKAVLIRCSRCGETDKLAINKTALMPPGVLINKFKGRGWDVDNKREGRDTCPKCLEKRAQARKKEEQVPPMIDRTNGVIYSAGPEPTLQAEPPIPMSRDDKRLVFSKLNEVYVDDKVGYGIGWTDVKVANDLGVPPAWVREVREENFGPEASNEEIRTAIEEGRAILGNIADYLKALDDHSKRADAHQLEARKLVETSAALRSRGDRFETVLRRIEKQVGLSK